MHLRVWKRIKARRGSRASSCNVYLIPTRSDDIGKSGNGSHAPDYPDRGRPLDAQESQTAAASGICALQGETSLSLETEPLSWQTKPVSLQTGPLCASPSGTGLEVRDTLTEIGGSSPQSMGPQVFSERPGTDARFWLVEKVHHGAMSIVWRAFDEARQTPVAVKLVPQNLAPAFDPQTLDRLVRASQHPGLVTLIEHGWQGRWWYQVAEWVDGDTLASLCRSHPIASAHATSLRAWMKQLAGALQAQHRAGFVHGDVKPSNVLVTSSEACLIDLVGLRVGDTSSARHLTPAYASPEARKGAPADPRDDVYSLAAMLFKLLTGELVTPERASDALARPPATITATQWRILREALTASRECRVKSTIELVDAMWPVSKSWPQRKTLRTPRRNITPAAAALIAQPRKLRRRRIGEHSWRVGGNAALAVALTALVVVGIGTDHMAWRSQAVPAADSQPFTERSAPLASFERVDSQPSAVVAEGAFEPAGARRSIDVTRAPASRGVNSMPVTPAISNPVVASTDLTEPAPAVAERTELAGTPDRPQGRALPVRPDVSAFADRAEVPLLPDRRQMARAAHLAEARVVPAVAYRLAAVTLPVRAESPAVGDPFAVPDAPARPDVPTVLVAALDRPELERSEKPERPEQLERPEKSERPELIERPDKPERPEVAERPEKPEVPEKPERPGLIERPEKPERPELAERPEKPERPELIERPDKPERPEVAERPEKPEVPEKPERPELIERPEKPERPELAERPEKPERPELIERPDKPERPEVAERPEKPEVPEKPERPETAERPEKPERPELIERPDKPERPEKPDRPEKPERPS